MPNEDHLRYAALGHPVRLDVCRRIAASGAVGVTPGALADAIGIPPNLVSHHLRLLLVAGLLTVERSGRENFYRAVPGALVDAGGALLELGSMAARAPVRS